MDAPFEFSVLLAFGFVSDFVLRISDFSLRAVALGSFVLLAGCAHPAPSLTQSAFVVRSGPGMIEYVADEPGDVYLLGPNSDKPLAKIPVRRGERIAIEPGRDRIEAGGAVARHKTALRPDRRYRLYFDRSE
ncbi:MAG TPA: hypothetical protein VFC78_10985 [Tepidisphaeraceae bacterium]|nr:hypothetical protein [Tepidisphaeraceae bacterium]